MQPVFPRIHTAIKYTLEYYHIKRIYDNMMRFAGNSWQASNPKTELDWYQLVFQLHQDMENEILQTVQTVNHITIVIMFEYLRDWLNDYRIKEGVNKAVILHEIEMFNDSSLKDFMERTEKNIEDYHASRDKSKKHLEIYEITDPAKMGLMGGLIFQAYGKPKTVTNYNYYCIEERPDLIDMAYFSQYINWIAPIFINFKNIINKHLQLYDTGKYIGFDIIKIAKHKLIDEVPYLPKTGEIPSKSEPKKLKVNLSVPQLAYLFKILYDEEIILADTKSEIARFLVNNFTTKMNENLSEKSIINKLSDTEKKEADFWANKFIELRNIAKKV